MLHEPQSRGITLQDLLMARKGSEISRAANGQVSVENNMRKKKRVPCAVAKKQDGRRNLFAIVRKYKPPCLFVEGNKALKGRCASQEAFGIRRTNGASAQATCNRKGSPV